MGTVQSVPSIEPQNNEKPTEHTDETKLALSRYFPGSLRGRLVENVAYRKLAELGFTSENTLFGNCSCPDEINHNDPTEDITSLFRKRWGQVFTISGIGGLPFVGKTGWGAFSSHVPKDGNIVVLFAPHVGVDSSGTVGKVHRHGIDGPTTACGAAVGAYNAVKDDENAGDLTMRYTDHQMNVIKHLVLEHVDDIKGQENEMAILAYKMYDIIESYLEEIINLGFCGPNSKLALIGGIMINCDGNKSDVFLPLKFEVKTPNGSRDYTEECFGYRNHRTLYEKK